MNFRDMAKLLISPIFGAYSGVQVFLAPITLFYLIESDSLLAAGTSLLSFRIHYFPLLAFSIVLSYIMFMLIKLRYFHHGSREEFVDTVIELNVSVMALLIIALIIYGVSSFMAYFYGINGVIKTGMYMLFKAYTAFLIIYHYLLHHLLSPFYSRGYGKNRAILAFKAWARNHKFILLRYSLLTCLIVLAATRIYQLLINLVLYPAINGINVLFNFDIRLQLHPFIQMQDVFINLIVCIVAFGISNLLFYPIIYGLNQLSSKFIPFKAILRSNHA